MTGRRARLAAVAAGIGLLAAACSGSSSAGSSDGGPTTAVRPTPAPPGSSTTTSTTIAPGGSAGSEVHEIGSFPVGTVQVDLVDTSRDTPANGKAPATSGRKLPTVAFYPAAGVVGPSGTGAVDGAPARRGRYPLIVFSHGVTARGIYYRGQLEAWASAGYVVVAPDYPLSNRNSPGGPTIADVGNQPGDASFLIDAFTDEDGSTAAADVAAGVDPDHIGAAGHSLGAITSLGLGYASCCADDRVDAVASWAGVFFPMQGGLDPEPGITDRPLLLVHGTKDHTVPYQSSESAFARSESPRWFITLPGQGHTPPFLSPGASPVAELVTTATLDFFDAELKGDDAGTDRLAAAVTAAGPTVATLQTAGT